VIESINGVVKIESILNIRLTFFLLMQYDTLPERFLIDSTDLYRRACTMAQTILEMATDLTTALIQAGRILPEALQDTLQKTYASLMELKTKGENGAAATPLTPVNWRKSIARNSITCLECGSTFKQLSRHLRDHNLDAHSYRAKYGILRTQPLAARSVTAMRKTIAQRVRPWEKAPGYVKAQGGKTTEGKAQRKRTARVKG
jgi:predicted transcriptional regulator